MALPLLIDAERPRRVVAQKSSEAPDGKPAVIERYDGRRRSRKIVSFVT
jgi:hypothetical protein